MARGDKTAIVDVWCAARRVYASCHMILKHISVPEINVV